MTSDRYLPRAPSLRPAPRKRLDRKLDKELGLDHGASYGIGPNKFHELAQRVPSGLAAPGAGGQSRVSPLPLADLPAPPARGPWEPKED